MRHKSLAPSAPSPGLRASSPQLQRTLEMVYRLTLQRRDPWWDSFPQKGIGDLGTPKRWQGTPYSSKRNSKCSSPNMCQFRYSIKKCRESLQG
ncbi:hypothetical protein R6Z07F_016739 [Ovis aries]